MNYVLKAVLFTFAAALLASCSSSNSKNDVAIFDPAAGKHPAGWASAATGGAHLGAVIANPNLCFECHGTDMKGGTSGVSCFSASRSGIGCHPNGPLGVDPKTGKFQHPSGWAVATIGGAHPAAFNANATICFQCHGTDLKGGVSVVSCFSASRSGINCHPGGPASAPHAVPFPNHGATASSNVNFCLGCHVDAITPAGASRPGCRNCHLSSPVTTPSGCTSCHGKPPASATYPDTAGSHAPHATLNVTQNATLTAVCDECHNGLGLGTLDHLNRSRARTASVQANPVAFGTLAKTGGLVPTYTSSTGVCTNTYCHGSSLNTLYGDPNVNVIPVWNVPFVGIHCNKCHGYPPFTAAHGSIPAPTQCINCHLHVNSTGTGFTDPTKHINGVIDL